MSTTIISAQQHAADIDALLEQYLHLLDTYTSLRAKLSATLSSINQNIARANFSAPRGVRYGEELYDQRMRASCTCHFSPSPSSSLSGITLSISSSSTETESAEKNTHPYDPLHMFGILLPTPLRSAAAESSGLVRDLVPRIIETDMQMREMEIRIRRGRKGLRKAGGGEG